MNERIKEFAEEAGLDIYPISFTGSTEELEAFAELVEEAARADERNFIATKWENLYGYDKQGVAEFIRKRANTQEETT